MGKKDISLLPEPHSRPPHLRKVLGCCKCLLTVVVTSAEAPCRLPVLLSRFSVVRLQLHVLCPVRALIPTPHGESASHHLSNTLFPHVLKDLPDIQGLCAFSVDHSFIALISGSDLRPASKGSKSVRYPLCLK